MADQKTFFEAVESRGPYAVWDLMDEDEKKTAAVAFWNGADRENRSALEMALAAELKFRQQSVRQLAAERVAGRLVDAVATRCPADQMSDSALFSADLGAGDSASGEAEQDGPQPEPEDPFLMLKEAMSQSH